MIPRCSAVIRAIRSRSSASPGERELLAELERHKRNGDRYLDQIQTLKEYAKRNREEVSPLLLYPLVKIHKGGIWGCKLP